MIYSRVDRRRRRQLAADDRTGVWARRQIRAERLHVLRMNWRVFSGMVVVAALFVGGVAFLIPFAFFRGLVVGISASLVLGAIGYLILALSGTVAPGMGATAEMWTASELRRLRRHGWTVVNGVPLKGRDVDHVLVGPGGVVVVESKWSSYGWHVDPPDHQVQLAMTQVAANARTLRLWEGVKASGAPVSAVVFLWGGSRAAAPERPPAPVTVDQISVAYGRVAVRAWVSSLVTDGSDVLSAAVVAQVWRALDRVVRARERVDESAVPPRSLDSLLWTALCIGAAFLAVVLASLELLTVSLRVWAISSLVLLVIGLALGRWRPARPPAAGGLAGLAAVAVLVVVTEVIILLG